MTLPRVAPAVSVILPTRNRLALLKRALDGVRAQNWTDYEVIVADDGSNSETRAKYAEMWTTLDERFRLISISESATIGCGPAAARNFAARHAAGRFLAFCDDDDFWCDPEYLRRAVAALDEDPEADLFFSNQRAIDSNGALERSDWMPHLAAVIAQRKPAGRFGAYALKPAEILQNAGSLVFHLNVMVCRADFFRRLNGFWEGLLYESDREFLLRAVDGARRILYRPDIVATHNIPDPKKRINASTRFNERDKLILKALVGQHVLATSQSAEVVEYARAMTGYAFRYVATSLAAEGAFSRALCFANAALAAKSSMKWRGYIGFLGIRAALSLHREVRNRMRRAAARWRHRSLSHGELSGGPTALVASPPAPALPTPPANADLAIARSLISGEGSAAPIFSVIVPTRNRCILLERALTALSCQTLNAIEVIVVDDGSSIECRESYRGLLAKLDRRFRLIELGPPGHSGSGPSAVRNLGIAEARGTYLAFCDDDDYWCDTDHLLVAAQALSRVPECNIYIANQVAVRNGVTVRDDWLPGMTTRTPAWPKIDDRNVFRATRADLIELDAFAHLNILIVRRDLAKTIGGFWPLVRYEEDLDFYWRLLDHVEVALFRSDIVSVHCIPDPMAARNVSTEISLLEQRLLRALICQHVGALVTHPDLLARVSRSEGDALRHVTLSLVERGRYDAARSFGWRALGARFSLKWAAYTGALRLR
jgi:glycosyltransferase involved in cell wall biosynthesis